MVGREQLLPAAGTEVLARFGDGAAVTRHAYGKGHVYVVGFFPGLEYHAKARRQDFDFTQDFDAEHRAYVAGPALERVKPVVDASEPLVEGVLLKNNASGRRAVTLVNWAFRVSGTQERQGRSRPLKETLPFQDLKVTIRGAGDAAKVTSAATGKALQVIKSGNDLKVVVPVLEEADVLLLE